MTAIVLREDQYRLKQGIYDGWNAGKMNMLGVLPTGGGKSVIVSDIVLDKNQLGAQQAVIAHRVELVSQMSIHVGRRGIKHQIIAPKPVVGQVIAAHREEFGRSFVSPSAACSVVAVDTLLARADDLVKWAEQQDYWTIDEAHHVQRLNKWGRAAELFVRARGLGVTASPRRADGGGLGRHSDGVFDDMIVGPSPRQLIDIGAITDYEIVCPVSDLHVDEKDIGKTGDWSTQKLTEASEKSHIVGDVVENYIRYAYGKRTIVFATDVKTARKIAENFKLWGIPAAAVDGNTPTEVRDNYIKRFKRGEFWVLVNVDLFGEGFDVPAVECVIMARPTASLSVYLQQAGRALRSFFGKTFGLIIDHVSNVKRHGLPDKFHLWTLDRRDKRAKKERDPEDVPIIVCQGCSRPYEAVLPACPHCGHVPVIEPTARASIEFVQGDLVLLDRAKLAALRAATELESPASVGQRVNHVAGGPAASRTVDKQIERIQAQQRLKDAIALWAGMQRHKGRSDQESYRRFYHAAGVDVVSAQTLPAVDMDALTDRVMEWIK